MPDLDADEGDITLVLENSCPERISGRKELQPPLSAVIWLAWGEIAPALLGGRNVPGGRERLPLQGDLPSADCGEWFPSRPTCGT